MKQGLLTATLLSSALLVPAISHATETSHWYFVDFTRIEADAANNQEAYSEALRVGINLPMSESVDLQLAVGKGRETDGLDIKSLISGELIFNTPSWNQLTFQGSLGWNRIELEFDSLDSSEAETAFTYGFGANYQFNESWKIHAWYKDFNDFEIDGTSMDMTGLQLGLDYQF